MYRLCSIDRIYILFNYFIIYQHIISRTFSCPKLFKNIYSINKKAVGAYLNNLLDERAIFIELS